MGSPFTSTLANIFISNWEQESVGHQRNSNEIYGRYIDDIFLTFNDSIEQLHRTLAIANNRYPNMKLIYQINIIFSFLDVQTEKKYDQLLISVYHKSAAEPYVAPFKSDHPRHIFANITQGALIRAIHYSSTLQLFDHEKQPVLLMLFYNGYPIRYIHVCQHFQKFPIQHSIPIISYLPTINDENEYQFLRCQILSISTESEHAQANRIATQINSSQINSTIDPLVKMKLINRQQKEKSVIIHYSHENRFLHYKTNIYKIWNVSFPGLTRIDSKLIVATRNNANLTKELLVVQRRPRMISTTIVRKQHHKKY